MAFLAVIGVDNNSGLLHTVIVDDKTFSVVGDYGFVSEGAISSRLRMGGDLIPLNFNIDRSGKLLQDCGSFERFSKKGSAVVIAEIKSRGGRTLGYRLLSCATKLCANLKLEEILQREQSMQKGEHFLQNGIIRNGTVNCYPMRPFHVMTVEMGSRKPAAKPQEPVQKSAKQSKPVEKKSPKEKPPFTREQTEEIKKCKERGGDVSVIYNPELSPSQMRILWIAKSKGCCAEAFANPQLSTDAMKFYADRLYDPQTVADCSELLAHPELGVDELSELYACVCQGIPYSDMIGMSAIDIDVKRTMASQEYWGIPDAFDKKSSDSLVDERALQAARRVRGV